MKSTVEVEIRAPHAKVAGLFADPMNNVKWMDDLDRIETLSGQTGMPASRYRMVPKEGKRDFVVTVLSRDLPDEMRLQLDGSDVVVSIQDRFYPISENATRLVSEEVFNFRSPIGKVMSLFVQGKIKAAHRRHMTSFKRFAEGLEP